MNILTKFIIAINNILALQLKRDQWKGPNLVNGPSDKICILVNTLPVLTLILSPGEERLPGKSWGENEKLTFF